MAEKFECVSYVMVSLWVCCCCCLVTKLCLFDDGISAGDTAAEYQKMYSAYLTQDWAMIGAIIPYATATIPANCLACDGALYNRVDYPLLYAALHSEERRVGKEC